MSWELRAQSSEVKGQSMLLLTELRLSFTLKVITERQQSPDPRRQEAACDANVEQQKGRRRASTTASCDSSEDL